jgi:hypothetical protein
MILTVLTTVLGATVAQWLVRNLMMIGIAAAVLAGSNLISAVTFYVKGHNAAAAKCQVNSIKRERDELKRDLGVQKKVADEVSAELETLRLREAEREQKGAEDAAKVTQIPGCVVLPRSAPGVVRRKRAGG